ncbi:MAG: OsmC family protein [Thermoleophilia bacterium]|nr:OsmC family protein [Thermoleophilia bacterium]
MSETINVRADLLNKVQFRGVSETNPDRPVQFDYIPPLGDGDGFAGLELLLLSLAGCSATGVAYVVRKMGKTVDSLSVNAKGLKVDGPPMKFDTIDLEFLLRSPGLSEDEAARVLSIVEEMVCPVWAMIRGNCEVRAEIKLLS